MRAALIVAGLLLVGGILYAVNGGIGGDSTPRRQASTPSSRGTAGFELVGFFITPSGRIACRWLRHGRSASLVCGVATGLHPPIPRRGDACRRFTYVGNQVGLSATGRTRRIACAEGSGPFADPSSTVYLHYGDTWTAPGLECRESVAGLTCRNGDRHGFFLSLDRWFTF